MNVINRSRVEVGLTRPELLSLLGAKAGRTGLFLVPDDKIDRIFKERAELIVRSYRMWSAEIEEKLSVFERVGQHEVTMEELSSILGLRDTAITSLRSRRVLGATLRGHEYFYPLEAVRQLIRYNSTVLADNRVKTRGPLAAAFLRWFRKNQHRLMLRDEKLVRELQLIAS